MVKEIVWLLYAKKLYSIKALINKRNYLQKGSMILKIK